MKYLIPINLILIFMCLFLAYNQYDMDSRIKGLREDTTVNRYLWQDLRVNHNTAEALNGFFTSHFDKLKKIENELDMLKENKN